VMGYVDIKRGKLVQSLIREFSYTFTEFSMIGREEFLAILENIQGPAGAQQGTG